MRKNISIMAAIAALLCLAAPVRAAEYELVFQSHLAENNIVTTMLREWATEVEKKSEGRLALKFVANAAITRFDGAYKGLTSGAVDMGTFSPNLTLADLPYSSSAASFTCLSRNAVHGTHILNRMWNEQEKLRKELDKVTVLGMWTTAREGFHSAKGPITKPEDFAGKRIMVFGEGILSEILRAEKANMVQVGIGETYVGIQRGMGEAFALPLASIRAMRLNEVIKYTTIFPYYGSAIFLATNKKVFESLPQDLQALLLDAGGQDLSLKLAKALEDSAAADMEKNRAEGIEVSTLTGEDYETMKAAFIKHGLEWQRRIYSRTALKNDFDSWYAAAKAISEELSQYYDLY